MKKEHGSISLRALFSVAVLFVALMVLIIRHSTAQGHDVGDAATAASVADVTAAPVVGSKAARKIQFEHDVAQVTPLLGQWSAAADLARSTPPAGLGSRIAELQDIRVRFGAVQLSEQCAVLAQQANGDAMDARIAYFTAVMNHWPTVPESLERAEKTALAAKNASADCHA